MMRIALHTVVAVSRKEPLHELVGRVRKAFLDAGLGEPSIRFSLMEASSGKRVSAIDRALKRYPEMERFLTRHKMAWGGEGARTLSNVETGEPAAYATLEAIAAGIPRSLPFHGVVLHFYAAEFGERLIGLPAMGHSLPGVLVRDNRWGGGRERELSVYTVAEVEATDKKLPPNAPAVEAVIKALGKAKKAVQVPIRAPGGGLAGSIALESVEAVKAIEADYRARIGELVEAAAMPHRLPPAAEAWQPGVLAGPRKPVLEAAFKPMGYSCTGGSGVFHLARRTLQNLTVELNLDVGTWSHAVSAIYLVKGAGFQASLGVPVAPERFGQYPIGDAEQWQKIVENLAAMVRELERSFVPAVEQAAGPSPAWYEPPS